MWTHENTWFSSETGKKGQIKAGQLAFQLSGIARETP